MICKLTRLFNRVPVRTFCSQSKVGSTAVQTDTPVHLRQYDPTKYEKPSSKIKLTTGYAFLDVDPMPRARIMKICYIILDKLAKEIPENVLYRLYTEEKVKYIMRITDQIEDIRRLEEEFGFETIEYFIQSLYNEINLVDYAKQTKPWEITCDDKQFEYLKQKEVPTRYKVQDRPQRTETKFIN